MMSDIDAGKASVRLVKREKIDFKEIAAESGIRRGKICVSKLFGWCVQNADREAHPSVGCITPPEINDNQILKIEDNHWCIYEKFEAGQ